ncbi:MAG TPA: DUF1634 domain-containing protein [Chloroflexia bacterium]|nr:DUF1634 domain-containing protein [Chloroflexia bacterium]
MDLPLSNKSQDNSPVKLRPSDKSTNSLLSFVLRGGVILSAVIIALGVLLFIVTGQSGYAADQAGGESVKVLTTYHTSGNGQVYFPTNPQEILQGAVALKPFAIVMTGLMLLVLTPILNVALAGFEFLQKRDKAYTFISLFVLAILVISFFLGKAGE